MKRLKKQIPYLFLFLYLALIFVSPPKYINYPKLIIVKLIRLPLYLSNRVFYNLGYLLRSKTLIEENKDLYNKLQVLKGKVAELEELKAENKRFKEILSFKEKGKLDFVAVPIIAKDSTALSSSIIIGAGKIQGVDEKTVVVTASGVVGRVIESSSDTSRVLLITDPNSRISAVGSRSRCEGMLYGISGGLCKMVYLPLDADIKKEDIIATSGFSSYFPKGLILGRVTEVARAPRGLSLYAIIKPEFDLSRIEEVSCIK